MGRALGPLFARHQRGLRVFLTRKGARAFDVDDLIQDTYLAASVGAAPIERDEAYGAFLRGIAGALLRRRRRSIARGERMLERLSALPRDEVRDPEYQACITDALEETQRAVQRLSRERRVVLLLVEWNGLGAADVAARLRIPIGTVWRRLHEARAKIRSRALIELP